VLVGDCISVMKGFPDESIDLVMFSPPYYGLRNYGEATEIVWGGEEDCSHEWIEERMTLVHENRNFLKGTQEGVHGNKQTTYIKKYDDGKAGFCTKCGAWKGQLGLEPSWQMYVEHIRMVCREINGVLKDVGSLYIVLGDTYAGSHCGRGDKTLFQNYRRVKVAGNLYEKPSPQAKATDYKPKCLIGIPWRVAFSLIEDDWILRNDIIWHKPNAMPSSVKDRLTQTYEHIFHFVKSRKYYYDLDAVREASKSLHPSGNKARKPSLQPNGRSHVGRCIPWIPFQNPKHFLLDKNLGNVTSERVKANIEHFAPKGSGGHYACGGLDSKEGKHNHPLGKNPGDVFQTTKEPYVGNNPHRMRLKKEQYLALDSSRPMDLSHPKGKNPGDVVLIKHDLAVNRVGNLSYTDPLHVKAYNIKGKNPGDYWDVCTKPFKGAHFAVYPEEICIKPILSSCPPNGIVLDPMCGSGTTLAVAKKLGRGYIGIEINPNYVDIATQRLLRISPLNPLIS